MKAPQVVGLLFATTLAAQSAVNFTTTFSSAEGYVAGALDKDDNAAQPRNWERVNAAQADSFTVGPPGITVTPRASGTLQAVAQSALNLNEGAVTTFLDFTFSQSATTPTGNQTVAGMAYLSNFDSGNLTGFSGVFQITATGYQLVWGNTSTAITATQLGIDIAGSDFQSIPLRLSMTLTKTTTADTFTRTASLINLTNQSVITSTTSQSFTSAGAYADSAIYSSMTSGYTTATQITGVTFQGFSVSQVPEPGTVGLCLLGGLFAVRRNRR